MADLARPDLGRFPALARVRGTSCVLEPGDALYIPANMLHYVHQLDAGDENLSLNFWFGDGSRGVADALVRGPSPAAVAALPPAELRFHVHRILEKSAANLVPEGTQWGRFLTAWSDRGADASLLPKLPRGVRGFLFRTQLPKLAPLLDALEQVAADRKATVGQVALAWCLNARGPGKPPPLPLVGARTPAMVRDVLGALDVKLDAGDVASLADVARRAPQAQKNSFQTK